MMHWGYKCTLKPPQSSAAEFSSVLLQVTKAKVAQTSKDTTKEKKATVLHQGTKQSTSSLKGNERGEEEEKREEEEKKKEGRGKEP